MSPMAVALLLLAATEGPQAAREPPPPDTIAVTGAGAATLAPDRVTFTVGVESMAPSVQAAVDENNARIGAVLAALKKEGATEKEIRTAGISISPQMDYQQGRAPRVAGYQVSNRVTVTRSDFANVGRLLQASIDAGANQVIRVQTVPGMNETIPSTVVGSVTCPASPFIITLPMAGVTSMGRGSGPCS